MSKGNSSVRTISTTHSQIMTSAVSDLPEDLRPWFVEQAAHDQKKLGLRWLLAHCMDGVIWGELRDDNVLHLSCDQNAFPIRGLALRKATLQQARFFGPQAELLVWRGPQSQWHTTLRRDDQGEAIEIIDEQHVLWGNRLASTAAQQNGFIQIAEGSQGIVHAPPISIIPSDTQRAALQVRHYLHEDQAGVVRICASRLMGLGMT